MSETKKSFDDLHESMWIRSLRAQVEGLNRKPEVSIREEVHLTMDLGDARRLLAILDLARDLIPHRPPYRDANQEIIDEAYLLATGAMEG